MSRRIEPFITSAIEITDTGTQGKGIARSEKGIIFVDDGVPGDIAEIFVYKREKKFYIGRIENLIQPSPFRVEPKCKHFGNCGGCKWQNLDYSRQLFFKHKQVIDPLERIGHLELNDIRPIIGVDDPWHYRNKIEFTFSDKRWLTSNDFQLANEDAKTNALGFHVSGYFDKILHIDECFLPRADINAVRNEAHAYALENNLEFYNVKSQQGFLRNLIFRTSEATDELVVILVTNDDNREVAEKMLDHLFEIFPTITSTVWIHNPKQNSSYSDLQAVAIKGDGFLTEKLGGWKYRISPVSFFQTNSKQAERLYTEVKNAIGSKRKIIYDLYCGAGSIGIFVNELAEKIVGIEFSQQAVEDAKVNVELNNLKHLSFIAGDMKKILNKDFFETHGKPDLVIADPPRGGMDVPVTMALLESAPANIIYVSCNPATQARDLAFMKDKYKITSVQPVDMFPHTTHVESIVCLELIDKH